MATTTTGKVHEMSQKGFGEGTNELYDRARPTYPQPALEALWESLPERAKTGPLNVLELASGTGLFTRSLLAHPQFSTHTTSLLAIDPSAGMRAQFVKRMSADPRIKCEEGTFDELKTVESGWADVVCIAQAWHWCQDHDAALTEIVRTMKPDGVFALIWNIEDRDAAPWLLQLYQIYEPFSVRVHSAYGEPITQVERAKQTAQCQTYLSSFAPVIRFQCAYSVPTTIDGVVERVFSKSFMTLLKGEERDRVERELREVAERGEGKVWVDEKEGTFEWPYQTYLFISKRK